LVKVLIIEDDIAIVKVMRMILEREGFEVRSCSDEGCFEVVEEWDPAVILMDVRLPLLDGIEACLRLKVNPVTSHIPVVLITADRNIDAVAEEVCADDVLSKPFGNKALVEMVRTHTSYCGSTPEVEE
jgi:CheY-like chemotaxis protein